MSLHFGNYLQFSGRPRSIEEIKKTKETHCLNKDCSCFNRKVKSKFCAECGKAPQEVIVEKKEIIWNYPDLDELINQRMWNPVFENNLYIALPNIHHNGLISERVDRDLTETILITPNTVAEQTELFKKFYGEDIQKIAAHFDIEPEFKFGLLYYVY